MPENNEKRGKRSKTRRAQETTIRTNRSKRKPVKKQGSKNNKKPGTKKSVNKNKKQHTKLKTAIKIFIILILLLCVIGAGIVAGMFFGLFGNEFEITKDELKIGASNTVVVDQNGAVIANLNGDEKRKVITLADMSNYLPKAYVAIEDERYYKHSGVDFKRTAGAIVHTVFGGSSYGGSTITQQLVKNITKDDESSGIAGIFRKVKEWAKAYQVERMISKDQILELYLNILFVGSSNLHGVELGAEYYFNKSAKDLDLAECAFMAGINNSPNSYDPYDESKDNSAKIKKRTLTVLSKMKELGYIQNDDEYNTAVAKVEEGLKFEKGTVGGGTTYSYHTDAAIEQVINQVMEEKGISRQLAENYVYSSGLTIYSTVNPEIQARLEEEYSKSKYIVTSPSKKQTSQSGMAIVDYKTGNVLGVAGGLGEKNGAGWNRATQMKKQTGSSIKPLADVAPALEEKVITAATVYNDVKTDFGGGYTPKNDGDKYRGPINIRQFIETSQNIPALKIMRELTPKKSIEYLEKMGVTSLDEKEDDILSLAIGGMTDGISPLEMASAYGTIANDGVYITPTFYTKVVDNSGNTVLTPKQETKRAISEQNAYIVKKIVQEPVVGASGTAKYCAISGMDVAAKTGTTDKSYDRWLCGFTPYYTAVTWYGYDQNESIHFNKKNPAGLLWANVMSRVHTGLKTAKFEKPSAVSSVTICPETGKKARTGCQNTYTEYFLWGTAPGLCDKHTGSEFKNNNNTNNEKITNKVQEIVQGITEDIDSEDPQQTTINSQQNTNKNTTTNKNNDSKNDTKNTSPSKTNVTTNTNSKNTTNTTKENTSSNTNTSQTTNSNKNNANSTSSSNSSVSKDNSNNE